MTAPKHVQAAVDEVLVLNAFFHGSREPLPVGATLSARENTWRKQFKTEALVEAQRPPGTPSRTQAWFMTQDPCDVGRMGGGSYLYEVEPSGVVGPLNYDWVERVARTREWHDDFDQVPAYAANYWTGAPLSDRPQLEWLAPEIAVLREAHCPGRPWGDGRAALNAVSEAPYPSERSPEFEASLPPERRALLRRWFTGHHYGVKWSVFYRFMSTAPIAEVEAEVVQWEAKIARESAAAKAVRAEARAEARRYRGAARVEVDLAERRRQRLSGKDVWLYHGTSSVLLPRIRREGLRPDTEGLSAHANTTPGYVYLTVVPGSHWPDGGNAAFYAHQAVGKHGGRPVVLRVRVPWDALEPDEDDADIHAGRHQYRFVGVVWPEDIAEVVEL